MPTVDNGGLSPMDAAVVIAWLPNVLFGLAAAGNYLRPI
jgi:hypothetical protein